MLAATLPTQTPFARADECAPSRPVIVQPDGGRHLHAFGDHLQILLSSADTGGTIAVAIDTTPAGSGPPPHVHHREAELFIVLEGDMEFFAEGRWTRVAPGGAVFLPLGVPHTFRNAGTSECRSLVITTPGGFEQFFAGCAEVFAAAGPDAPPDLAAIGRVADAHGIEFLVPLGPPAA